MRFSWIRARGVVAVSAAVMALQGVPGLAQFVPYNGNTNQGYNQYQAHTAWQGQSAQQAQQQYTQPQYTQQQRTQPQYTQPQYTRPQNTQPQYTAMAFQGANQGSGTRGLNQPTEAVAPGQMTQSAPMQNYSSAPAAGCNNCQPAPAPLAFESYSSGGGATGSCGAYNTFDGGCGIGGANGGCGTGYGAGGGCLGNGLAGRRCGGRQWFGGMYGLFLERAGSAWVPLAFSTDQPVPHYPTRPEYVLNLQDVTETRHSGVEFRLGSTLGGNNGGCGPRYGWEAAYWGILEEDEVSQFTDVSNADAFRLYTNVDFRGLEYDSDGAGVVFGYRPLNDYVDYGPPTADRTAGGALDAIRVQSVTVRNRFSAQNIELNLLRLPLLGSGVGPSVGGFGAGGCATGACQLGRGGCGGCGGSRYSLTTLAGVRYLRLDEDFSLGINAQNENTLALIPIDLRSEVDNHLVGFQLGCNGVYRLGCTGRWALNCSANAGIYGNRSEISRSIVVPAAGNLRFVDGANEDFTTIESEENSVATIAELRLGASYQYSCNWRFFGGYRALGVSGIALAFDQLPRDFSSSAQVQEYVNTNGSLFLHGLQGGVEFTY